MKLLNRNYLQQKEKHQGKEARLWFNTFILMTDRVSTELSASAKCFE
jgi:hypothetical protein